MLQIIYFILIQLISKIATEAAATNNAGMVSVLFKFLKLLLNLLEWHINKIR